MPIKVLEIEFTEEIKPIWGLEKYEKVSASWFATGDEPIGWGYVNNNPWEPTISADRVRQTIVEQMGKELIRSSLTEQLAPLAAEFDREVPPISVVICTRDRTDLLKGALESQCWLSTTPIAKLSL